MRRWRFQESVRPANQTTRAWVFTTPTGQRGVYLSSPERPIWRDLLRIVRSWRPA